MKNGFDHRYRSLAWVALVLILTLAVGWVMIPFVPAVLWAAVLSVLTYPIYERFRRKSYSPTISALLTTVGTILIIGLPLMLVALGLWVQLNGKVQEFKNSAPAGQNAFSMDYLAQEADKSLKPLFERFSKDFSLTQYWKENEKEIKKNISQPLGNLAGKTAFGVLTLVIAFLTMFFMIRDANGLRDPVLDLLPFNRDRGKLLLTRLADTIRAVFVGVVLVSVIQGTIGGIAYLCLGIDNALMWGVATIILCMIPLVGSPIVYVPLSLLLFAQGKSTEGIILLVVGFGIISNVDNVLRPFVIGARVNLHPIGIFFSLLGGVLAFGPIGIMAGPLLLQTVLTISEFVREDRNGGPLELEPQNAG